MNESNQFIETFRQEAEELLADIEETVMIIEKNPQDEDAVNRLFRSIHTIKGSSGMCGLNEIADFTHHVETVLEKIRKGTVPVTEELINLVLKSCDHINAMLVSAGGKDKADEETGREIISGLNSLFNEVEEEGTSSGPDSGKGDPADRNENPEEIYRIRFQPGREIFSSGMDPVLLFDELRDLGDCAVVALTEKIPDLDEFDPGSCYLFWDITVTTHKGIDAVRDVFIFVEEESQIRIDIIGDYIQGETDVPVQRLGEILVDRGDATTGQVSEALDKQRRIGDLLIESSALSREKIKSALQEQSALKKKKSALNATSIRVPSKKLDNLINLVGELVITQARLSQVAGAVNVIELMNPVEEMERLTTEMRDTVLNIRMLPIGTTFNTFRRLVRDLSTEQGKDIDLVTEGAETELDKTVIDRLNDPLVHLIRNSIDHGIQKPEDRVKAGRPRKGTIRLTAEHKGAYVVIAINDDGRGLDQEAIRAKAMKEGLISIDAELSEGEIFSLIFMPGFSTAGEVTSISGRGVGMDVVKQEIESLGGSVQIKSQKDNGTSIILSLPLTLAIIEGLLVEVGINSFVIPLSMVEECVVLTERHIESSNGRNMIAVRGELIPFIRLRDMFAISNGRPHVEEIAVVQFENSRVGIVVDRIVGDHQTVIKSLSKACQDAEGVSGATILGDGTVALIIDVIGLIRCAEKEGVSR